MPFLTRNIFFCIINSFFIFPIIFLSFNFFFDMNSQFSNCMYVYNVSFVTLYDFQFQLLYVFKFEFSCKQIITKIKKKYNNVPSRMYSYNFSVTLMCPIKITMYSDFVLLPLNVIMYVLQCSAAALTLPSMYIIFFIFNHFNHVFLRQFFDL